MKDLRNRKRTRPGLVESIKNGTTVPIISDEAIFAQALRGHNSLVETYCDYAGYTLSDTDNLPRIARFYKLKKQKEERDEGRDFDNDDLRADYLFFVKNFLYAYAEEQGASQDVLDEAEAQYLKTTATEFARLLGYPRLDQETGHPLLILANLPFKVYLTTSPYTFLESALSKAGKTPRTSVIRWRPELRDLIDEGPPPDPELKPHKNPLVCHLFGLDEYSKSLVLTEDDYLAYLVDVSTARGDESRDSVPAEVRRALSGDLLVLGMSLNSWTFRALYAGLIKSDDRRKDKRGIAVQLPPSAEEEAYFQDYLQRETPFEPIWKDFPEYAKELEQIRREIK